MVTIPLPAEDGPELAVRKCPDPDLTANFTVAPPTAQPLVSTTVAVSVVEVEPSAFIEVADEARISEAAGATAVVVTATGICAVILVPTTFAVMVSVRLAELTVPEEASAE
ncbi:MAG: hypothetical protein WCV99_08435 [Sterolibacterium sp.]